MTTMTKKRTASTSVSECVCGGTMFLRKDTLIKTVRGKEFKLHGLSYHKCSTCGEITFNLKDNVALRIANAYKNNVTDIFFS
mgnify:CR=1 FL=1